MQTLRFRLYKRSASLIGSKSLPALREALSFSSPAARFSPAYKLWLSQKALGIPVEDRNGWDGRTHMVKSAGVLSAGLLLGARQELAKKGLKIELDEAKWKERPKVLLDKGFGEENKDYAYQNDCVNAMIQAIPSGGGIVLSATGTGKTKMAAQFFSWIKGYCLFVVDQVDLLYQSQKEIQAWLSSKGYDKKVGVVGNSKFEPERVTIATIQTLHAHRNDKRFEDWRKKIKIVLIDEIHVQMGRRNFDVVESIHPEAVFGLTATLQMRKANVRLKCWSICGPTVFELGVKAASDKGVLTKGVVVQVPVPPNNNSKKKVRFTTKNGRKDNRPANDYEHEVLHNDYANDKIRVLVHQAMRKGYAVALLCERVKHLKKLAKLLSDHNPQLFYGGIKVSERKKQIKKFEKGKEDLIIANKVFTKGINVKRIDMIIDTAQRPNKDDCLRKYGRGVRLHHAKDGLIYIGIFTHGFGNKAQKSQASAFKKAKIPVHTMSLPQTSFGIQGIITTAEKFLASALRSDKDVRLFNKANSSPQRKRVPIL